MDIQSLTSNALVRAAIPRQQNAAPGMAGASTQTSSTASQIQQPSPNAVQDVSPNRELLDSAVKATNEFISRVNNSLQFSIDDETGTSIIKVVDKNTKEVIRQIPSEEMLAIAKALDTIKGLLVHQKA